MSKLNPEYKRVEIDLYLNLDRRNIEIVEFLAEKLNILIDINPSKEPQEQVVLRGCEVFELPEEIK